MNSLWTWAQEERPRRQNARVRDAHTVRLDRGMYYESTVAAPTRLGLSEARTVVPVLRALLSGDRAGHCKTVLVIRRNPCFRGIQGMDSLGPS